MGLLWMFVLMFIAALDITRGVAEAKRGRTFMASILFILAAFLLLLAGVYAISEYGGVL